MRKFSSICNKVFNKMSESTISNRGAFILFEGIDRCGKSTQSELISQYCNNSRPTELIRFPDRKSSIGQLIDSYLRSASNLNDQAIHLLFSANRWEASTNLEAKLNSGINLVCDRYAYSGVAFTSAKGLDMDWCKTCDKGLPSPDCIIYLDMPVEEAALRGQYGEERYENIDLQLRVRKQFMALKAEDEAQGQIPWYVIDARKSIEDIHAEIKEIADKTIDEASSKSISRMWLNN